MLLLQEKEEAYTDPGHCQSIKTYHHTNVLDFSALILRVKLKDKLDVWLGNGAKKMRSALFLELDASDYFNSC